MDSQFNTSASIVHVQITGAADLTLRLPPVWLSFQVMILIRDNIPEQVGVESYSSKVPYNFYGITKLHIYHLFIMITVAFVWSIMNLVRLLMVERCRFKWQIPASYIIKRTIKHDYNIQ